MLETLLNAARVLLPLAYLLVAIDYGFLFFTGHELAKRTASRALRGTVLFHLLYLVLLAVRWQQFPAATVSQAVLMISLAVALVYVFVEWHGRESSTGFWMVSLVFLFCLLSSLLVGGDPPDRELFHSALFATHVSLALLGYAAFAVAAGYGFLFLELYKELKAGRFSVFYSRLPPLQVLERMMSGALVVGFIALTGAVVGGAVWAQRLVADKWLQDPKILMTLATWGLYAGALLLRRLRRWQGRQTALASLAGLGAILFSLVAVNIFFSDFHTFL